MKRSIKCRQIDMTMLQMEVDTTSGSAVVSGFDANAIASVQDGADAGEFTLILKKPFSPQNSDKPKCITTPLAADTIAYVTATDYDRVSIQISDLAGLDKDGQISIMILGTNHRFSY